MGVPAHDERDFAFAKKYELPIVYVIKCEDQTQVYTNDGEHINSDIVNGLNTDDACAKIINYLEEIHAGKKHITYKIHD
jgi:leucyl-tRNA synthetase